MIVPDIGHAAASSYLRELAAPDCSSATIRGYAHVLLRWFRFLHEQLVRGERAERDLRPTTSAWVCTWKRSGWCLERWS